MKTAFGDLTLDWRSQRLRRGGDHARWHLIGEETADLIEALMIADGLRLSGESLWRQAVSKVEPFDGGALSRMIGDANSALQPHDAELLVEAFTVRLVDVTPRPFLRRPLAEDHPASGRASSGASRQQGLARSPERGSS